MPADNEDNSDIEVNSDYVKRNKRKVMELAQKKESKVEEQSNVNFNDNGLPTLQPKSLKSDSKEIMVKCPHCSKELYINRGMRECVYCKEPLSEDLIASLFLHSEELERENISKQKSRKQQEQLIQQQIQRQNQLQQNNNNNNNKPHPLKMILGLMVLFFFFYAFNFVGDSSDSTYDSDSYSTSEFISSSHSTNELTLLNQYLTGKSGAYSSVGLSYEILEDQSTVLMVIDSSTDFGYAVINLLLDPELASVKYIQDQATTTLDSIANEACNYAGYNFTFSFVLDTDRSNILYSVVGGEVIENDFYNN